MDDDEIRLYLHSLLETYFPTLNLYYRPPGNMKLTRPCIVYEPKETEPSYANNETYVVGIRYQITILSDLPGYANARNIFALPNHGCVISGNQTYVSSNIVHDVFTVSVNSIT
jgi:hypothetical protein